MNDNRLVVKRFFQRFIGSLNISSFCLERKSKKQQLAKKDNYGHVLRGSDIDPA